MSNKDKMIFVNLYHEMERSFRYLLIAKKDRTIFESIIVSPERKTVFIFKYIQIHLQRIDLI